MDKIKLKLTPRSQLSMNPSIPKILKGEKGDKGDPGEQGQQGIQGEPGHSPVITASKSGTTTTIYADGVPIAQIEDGEGRMPEITADKVGTVTTIYVDGEPIAQISDGQAGRDGTDGKDGTDGHTPVITTSRSGKVVTILADGVDVGTVSDGADGKDGQDGHSPQVTASKTGKVTTISVDGTPIATVNDGNDGQAGQKGDSGISPSVSVSTITGGHRVSVIDASGTDTFDVMDGADGQDGNDGHSPQVTASKSGKVTTISVDGTAIASINDGNDGSDGQDGTDGTDGKSAYEYAQDGGYTGTEQEFAQKLAEEYVTDVQVNGTSVLTDGVANIPAWSTAARGVVQEASTADCKAGNSSRGVSVRRQYASVFYGLAEASGDSTQSASSNAVGTYTDDAKKAIRKMLGIPNTKWELINEVTVSEDATEIIVNTDSNGLPFKLRKLIAMFTAGAPTTGTRDAFYGIIQGVYNGATEGFSFPSLTYTSATSNMMARIEIEAFVGAPVRTVSVTGSSEGNTVNVQQMPKGDKFMDYITYLRIYQSGSTKSLIPAGATLKLYGIRYDD